MGKISDGRSFYRQYNKSKKEEYERQIAERAQKAIREKLQMEIEKAKKSDAQ